MITLAIHTANQWPDSICHISLTKLDAQWTVIDSLDCYIHATDFDPFFTSIHGIEEQDVRHSPTFKSFAPILTQWLTNEEVVAFHAPFEEQALRASFATHQLDIPPCAFKSLLPRAKEEWPDETPTLHHFATTLAEPLAPTDSEMIASIMRSQKWEYHDLSTVVSDDLQQHPIQSLAGETIVFTGGLQQMTRTTAARLVRQQGAMFSNTMTKHTTLLVISASSLSRHETSGVESTKWRRAKQLQRQGQPIQIITEEQFQTFLNRSSHSENH